MAVKSQDLDLKKQRNEWYREKCEKIFGGDMRLVRM